MKLLLPITLLATVFLADAQYIRGPRGGCYTITRSGNKRYVDRSLCEDRLETPKKKQEKLTVVRLADTQGRCYELYSDKSWEQVEAEKCTQK